MARSAEPELRADAVKVLSMHTEKEARRIVREALFDPSSAVRIQALYGIGYACDRTALPDIRLLVQKAEESEELLQAANTILERLSRDPPCEPLPWLGSQTP
jgi:HEAT repeat protein